MSYANSTGFKSILIFFSWWFSRISVVNGSLEDPKTVSQGPEQPNYFHNTNSLFANYTDIYTWYKSSGGENYWQSSGTKLY